MSNLDAVPSCDSTEGIRERVTRETRFARPGVPWWAACVIVLIVGEARQMSSLTALLVVAVAAWLVFCGCAAALGYRPADADRCAALVGTELWHFSRALPDELINPNTGAVLLSPTRCSWRSRMLRADRPWDVRSAQALYFFNGQPSLGFIRTNIDLAKCRSVVIVTLTDARPHRVFTRHDGVALLNFSGATSVVRPLVNGVVS